MQQSKVWDFQIINMYRHLKFMTTQMRLGFKKNCRCFASFRVRVNAFRRCKFHVQCSINWIWKQTKRYSADGFTFEFYIAANLQISAASQRERKSALYCSHQKFYFIDFVFTIMCQMSGTVGNYESGLIGPRLQHEIDSGAANHV